MALPGAKPPALSDVDSFLHACWSAAREAYPDFEIDPDAFARALAEAVKVGGESGAERHAAALYLITGCALGMPAALERFEATYFDDVDEIARRVGRAGNLSGDELRQRLREHLFARPASGGLPRVHTYRAQGSLRNWVRAAAMRLGLNLVTRAPKETPLEDEVLGMLMPQMESPELAFLKGAAQQQFRDAMVSAVRALEVRERNVLRYSQVDKLSIDEIGALYGVHRATAARWLSQAIEKTRDLVMERLKAQLRVGTLELDSVLRLVRSQADLTIRVALAQTQRGSSR